MSEVSRRRLFKSAGGLILGAALARVEVANAFAKAAQHEALARLRARIAPSPAAKPVPIMPPGPEIPPVARPAVALPLVRSTWAQFVNASFSMSGPGGSTTATLRQVTDLPAAVSGDETRFSLLFTAPTTAAFPQGIYQLQSGALATALFLVPVEQVSTSRRYEAVINRI